MNKIILFNIASRARPEKLHNLLWNIYNNLSQPNNCTFLIKLDDDDPKLNRYKEGINAFEIATHAQVNIALGLSRNKIHAINRSLDGLLWSIIVDVSDDFIFTKKGFDNIIREHCGPDDCLHFPEPYATKQNEKNRNNNIIIMACMGREYYNRFGYIFNPVYKSLFCDNEVTDIAKILGRYKYVDEDIFYHAHPNAGYGKADAQTRFTESFWHEDKKTYKQRKAKNFDL
jgi:hypothetical protein